MNMSMERTAGRRIGAAAIRAPRLVMSWEDWLTFGAALVTFLAVAVSIQDANWVRDMPPIVPTTLIALLVGMIAARTRVTGLVVHPVAIAIGVFVVAMMVQSYADGATVFDRLADFRTRMKDWWDVVRAGDISNDNLPFVTLVHAVSFLAAYLGAYAIYRWHNPWLAVLPGGIVLLANIGLQKGQPTGPFVVFLFGAMLLTARLYLQKSQLRWKRQGVEYPEFISVSAGQLTLALAGLLLLFAWLMPVGNQASAVENVWGAVSAPFTGHSGAFTRLFHNIDSQKGARLHNFGSFLPLQSNVKLGTKVLYTVKAGNGGLIRGTSYDEYTGNGWKAGDRDSTKVSGGDLAASPEAAQYAARTGTILQVTAHDADGVVLTAGVPLGTNVAVLAESPAGYRGDIEQLTTRRGLNDGDTYNSIGSQSIATAEQLEAAGADYPQWVRDRYLQLPKGITQRVRDESARVTAGAATPYGKAAAIEAYLRELPFDLNVDAPPAGRELTDFLLFDLKRGYFDYQATAMAVMLRTLGIPARIAVGYVLDPHEVNETTYTVRKDDAYTWVEVFFPGYGWVNFNPTQDRPSGGAGGEFGAGTDINGVLSAADLEALFGDGPIPDDTGAAAAEDALTESPVINEGAPWTLIWSLVGALFVVAAAGFAGRLAWNWGLGGLEGTTRLWARVQRFAGWARLGGPVSETPREWSKRIGHAIHRPHDATRMAEAYEETRYGPPDLQRADLATTLDTYRRLRNGLLQTVTRNRVPERWRRER
jgi:transglutaminase-like putative cysteine protease